MGNQMETDGKYMWTQRNIWEMDGNSMGNQKEI